NHEQASKGLLIGVFDLEVIQLAGRSQRLDLIDKFLGQLEWQRHQVRHVAADQGVQVQGFWQQFIELFCESRNAVAQYLGVERYIDAWNRDISTVLDGGGLFLQGGQTSLGTRDGVLLTSDVVVDDFEEFASFFRGLRDVGLNLVCGNTNHVWTQRAHAVVGVTVFITFDQGAHGRATGVDDVDNRFEVKDIRQRCQRGVLTQ